LERVRNPFAFGVDTLPESFQTVSDFKRNSLTFSATLYWGMPLKKSVSFGQKSRMKRVLLVHTQ